MTTVNFNDQIQRLNLNSNEFIIMGSGILQALNIRNSNDIDLVVPINTFEKLKKHPSLKLKCRDNYDSLYGEDIEIFTSWTISGESKLFNEIIKDSVIINGLRYASLELTQTIKQADARPKDLQDVRLIKEYLRKQSNNLA